MTEDTEIDMKNDNSTPKVIHAPGEFESGEKRRRRLGVPDPELEKSRKRREAYNRWRDKNKDEINAKRRRYDATPKGAFKKARRKAERRGIEWRLTFDDFVEVWQEAPHLLDPKTQVWRPAWQLRGSDMRTSVQLCRIDTSKPWMKSNVELRYNNRPLPKDGKLVDDGWTPAHVQLGRKPIKF